MSKRGLSTSFGVRGASINVSSRGVKGTVGVPGSGLSYSTMLVPGSTGNQHHNSADHFPIWQPGIQANQGQPLPVAQVGLAVPPGMSPIISAAVNQLTSPSLIQFRDMLVAAKAQQSQIKADATDASKLLVRRMRSLKLLSLPLVSKLLSKKLNSVDEEVTGLRKQLLELNDWMARSQVQADFETTPQAQQAYGHLVKAYESLRACQVIWDVSAHRNVNSVKERTTASKVIDRHPVRPDYAQADFVQFSGRVLRLPNAINEDLLIFPGVLVMERRDGLFALIDLQDITLSYGTISFIESERVPQDSPVIGQEWAKSNKDGSPDRRYANNHQIPVCQYGSLEFRSKTGLYEQYQTSNPHAAMQFGAAFEAYQRALST